MKTNAKIYPVLCSKLTFALNVSDRHVCSPDWHKSYWSAVMAGRIGERELIIPALRAAASRPDGYISTAQLIRELEEQFQPEGQDAEILDGRQDTHFSQKVRNLISHRDASTSMFRRGYLAATGRGIGNEPRRLQGANQHCASEPNYLSTSLLQYMFPEWDKLWESQMLRSLARKYEKDRKVACYTVAQASVITGVPAKLINHYLDRELGHLAAIGAGFRAVCKDGLLPVRLNYEYSDSLKEASRLEAIRLAVCNPRRKYVNVSGDQVSVRIDLARSAVTAGLNRFRSATAMIEKNDDVLSGEPCIKGTRISVYVIHGLHGACGRDEVKGAYPDLSDREIDAALMYAEAFPRKGRPRSVGARLEKAKPTRSRVVRVKLPA